MVNVFLKIFIIPIFFLVVHGQDLGGGSVDYFATRIRLAVGSVVYIKFDQDFSLNFSANSEKSTTENAQLAGVLSSYFPFLPQAPADDAQDKNMDIVIEDQSTGTMAATITAYDEATDSYRLSATRSVVYNDQDRSAIFLNALVSARDVNEERSISIGQLANFSLIYRDKMQRIQLTEADFASLLERATVQAEAQPANETTPQATAPGATPPPQEPTATQTQQVQQVPSVPVTELTEQRKREILLLYLNWILSSWF